jgi:hypothetical protein
LGVSTGTVTIFTGASCYDCGIPGEPPKFGGFLGVTAGSISSGVIEAQAIHTPTPIRITANGGTSAAARFGSPSDTCCPRVPQS